MLMNKKILVESGQHFGIFEQTQKTNVKILLRKYIATWFARACDFCAFNPLHLALSLKLTITLDISNTELNI